MDQSDQHIIDQMTWAFDAREEERARFLKRISDLEARVRELEGFIEEMAQTIIMANEADRYIVSTKEADRAKDILRQGASGGGEA